MRHVVIMLLCACGSASGAATSNVDTSAGLEEPPPPPPPYAGRHVVSTVGDSTCVPMAALLQAMRGDLIVANHCRNGAETPEVSDHQWALNTREMQNSDAVVLLAGVNDVGHNLDVPQAYNRLLGISDEAVALGIDAYIVVTLPYRSGHPYGATYTTRMGQMEDGLRTAAPPVHLIDLVSAFVAHQEWYVGGSDFIHPNELGQAAIAEALAEAIP